MCFLLLQIGLRVVPADAGKSRVCWSNAGSGLEIANYWIPCLILIILLVLFLLGRI